MFHKQNIIASKFWKNKKILITGGKGFLGTHIVRKIKAYHPSEIVIPNSQEHDLRLLKNIKKMIKGKDIIIHLAAKVGGIGFNLQNPGSLFYDNIIMGVQLIEEARKAGVQKFVAIGTICAYPKFTPIPFKEENLWDGYPEETNAPYGLAKKMLLVQSQAYRKQYGFNSIYLLPVNLYGPGDNFDPVSSHVIPSIIRKVEYAMKNNLPTIEIWGTGKPTREFLYVEDCAEAILLATQNYNSSDPVNIGAGFEITIYNLVKKISTLCGYKGKIIFDNTKPDGQPRRFLDVSKAWDEFGFKASMHFAQGLKKTILWYRKNASRLKIEKN